MPGGVDELTRSQQCAHGRQAYGGHQISAKVRAMEPGR
jgi:hypothetical protein